MLETVFRVLKLSVIIAVGAVFLVAINTFINLIATIVFHSVVGEFFALISMYLPFNASAVFGVLGLACSGILSFLIAKKIFDLTSWSISTT